MFTLWMRCMGVTGSIFRYRSDVVSSGRMSRTQLHWPSSASHWKWCHGLLKNVVLIPITKTWYVVMRCHVGQIGATRRVVQVGTAPLWTMCYVEETPGRIEIFKYLFGKTVTNPDEEFVCSFCAVSVFRFSRAMGFDCGSFRCRVGRLHAADERLPIPTG
jgi:hypothetical protein